MSLLDNASLLLTPNAYKEGKLYSVIPSNGNGDFTATRATTATRVNSSGLVDLVPYNLVRYSEMFADASWTRLTSTVSANIATAPDGTLTADKLVESTTNNFQNIFQVIPQINSSYTYSVYLKKGQNDRCVLFAGSTQALLWIDMTNWTSFSQTNVNSYSINAVGNDWYRVVFTYTNTSSASHQTGINLIQIGTSNTITYAGNTSNGLFIWGAQLVEGTSARDYLRTETRLNIPRVDYSLGGCPNILLEPQRTNLVLQSSSFDNATWTKGGTSITANTTTSPSGVVDADTLTANGVNQFHEVSQSYTLPSATTYSWSVYLKKNTNDFAQVVCGGTPFGSTVWANFDLNLGVVGSVGSATTASIQSVGDGWYRCIVSGAASSTASATTNVNIVTSATSVRRESNTLSTSVFLWGAQLEAGAYATSYIPTTTASVTRNADSITRNNIFTNGLITAAGGTWFVELRGNISLSRENFAGGLFINTGTISNQNNGLLFRTSTSPSRISISKIVGGTLTELYLLTTDTAKVAIKWNGTTADVFVNGVKQVSATSFTTTAMQNLIGEGQNRAVYINEMILYPTPLTDTQLIELTTL